MIKTFLSVVVIGLFAVAKSAIAESSDVVYKNSCAICHGAQAQGVATMKAPALAGQQSSYLLRQLNHFVQGLRGSHEKDTLGAQMRGFAATLDPQQRTDMANYLSSLEPSEGPMFDAEAKEGKRYYQSYCGSCHGPKAQGNELLNSPQLRSLSKTYLSRQYGNFLQGVRGSSKEDKYGRQMALIAKGLDDPDTLAAIIDYIHSLK